MKSEWQRSYSMSHGWCSCLGPPSPPLLPTDHPSDCHSLPGSRKSGPGLCWGLLVIMICCRGLRTHSTTGPLDQHWLAITSRPLTVCLCVYGRRDEAVERVFVTTGIWDHPARILHTHIGNNPARKPRSHSR